jgi:hypothetical protein
LAINGHSQPHQIAPRNIAAMNNVKFAAMLVPRRPLSSATDF